MAKIYDVELKDISITQGVEDWIVEAVIQLKGELVGRFLDEGNGGPGVIKFNCDLSTRRDFYYVAWRYFASYPEIDSIALCEYTQKEFSELKSSLPKVSYKEWPDEKVAMFFVDKLLYLHQLEQQYAQAREEGYEAIMSVRYFALKNAKYVPEKIYYTDGTEQQAAQVIDMIEQENRNYIVTIYNSYDDFVIG